MKEKKNITVCRADFGESTKYNIFVVRNSRPLIPFIRHIQQLTHNKFSYLGDITPDDTQKDLAYPVFHTALQHDPDEYFILLPNRIAFHPNPTTKADNLQGFFLFDDDYYLFNRQGQYLIPCNYIDYDYVCMFFGDKDNSLDNLLRCLLSDKETDIQEISSTLFQAAAKGKSSKKMADLLYNFLGDTEVMIDEYRSEHLRLYMAPRQVIADSAIRNSFIHNKRFLSAELWRKEEE